jgi:hypothetical protein
MLNLKHFPNVEALIGTLPVVEIDIVEINQAKTDIL